MTQLLLIVLFAWIAGACGQSVLLHLKFLQHRPLERFVYGCALGLGIAAYGVLALGMCGALSPAAIDAWWTVMALIGARGMRTQAVEVIHWFRSARANKSSTQRDAVCIWIARCCSAVLAACLLVALVACFQPPGGLEWDGLSYHLAAPKIYLQQHRITVLPTQHQTNFPFTTEMLYTVGLAFGGYALANLFHLLFAVLATLGIIAYGERRYGHGSGYLGALIFVTTPLVLWEASVAYIDLAVALYGALGAFAVLSAIQAQRANPAESNSVDTQCDTNPDVWLTVAGCMIGIALGTKYLALVPLAVMSVLLIWRKLPLKSVIRFGIIALVIGSPWYVKNAALMGNPVYPFAYRLFPHTRYWSQEREAPYRHEQDQFGYPHALSDPRASLINLLDSPWTVVADANRYYNPGEFTFSALIGGIYAAFCLALLVSRQPRGELLDLLLIAGAQFAAWFFVSQVGRYLIPVLPLFAVASGISAAHMLRPKIGSKKRSSKRSAKQSEYTFGARVLQIVTLLLLAGQTTLLFGSVTLLPRGGRDARDLVQRTGLPPTALALTDAANLAGSASVRQQELSQHLDNYDAFQWINRNADPRDGVILYEDTRGYYLDRPYLWGNDQHSSYIPYDSLPDGEALTDWMNEHGFRYAVINLNWSPDNATHAAIDANQAAALVDDWYVHPKSPPAHGSWRRTVGDAVRKGLWTIVDVVHGNVILRIGNSTGGHVGSGLSARSGGQG